MKVIEHYKSAIESSDEHLLKEVFCSSSPHRHPGWSKRQLCSEHGISSSQSSREDRFWNQIRFNGMQEQWYLFLV